MASYSNEENAKRWISCAFRGFDDMEDGYLMDCLKITMFNKCREGAILS